MPALSVKPALGDKPSLCLPLPRSVARQQDHEPLRLAQSGNGYARSQVATLHIGLIGSVIHRRFDGRDWDECWQVGAEGLMRAIDRWPGQGNWGKFAWTTIYYAILTYVTNEPEPMASLDTDEGEAWVSAIADDRARPDAIVPDEMVASQLHGVLTELLSGLPERDQIIVSLRYGLDDGETHTYDEIGQAVGLDGSQARRRLIAIHKQLAQSDALRQLVTASMDAESGA